MVEAVGKDAALKIAALFPMGCAVYVPLWAEASRRIEVLELSRAGRGVDEVARLSVAAIARSSAFAKVSKRKVCYDSHAGDARAY